MNPLYVFGWLLVRILATVFGHLKFIDREHIPREGGFIIACNHISYYDPPVLGSCIFKPINYLAKKELFKNPLFGWVLRTVHALPVRRGTIDRSALEACENILKGGGRLILFPEGTRSKTNQFLPPRPGVGMLARSAGVPIVPAFIQGSNRLADCLKFRDRVKIIFGPPVSASWITEMPAEKESYQAVAEEVMRRIKALKESLTAGR